MGGQTNRAMRPSDIGVLLPNGKSADFLPPGDYKTLCPKCSHTRKHRADPCLSLSIRPDGDWVVNCHNCSWGSGRGGDTHRSRFDYAKPRFVPREPVDKVIDWFWKRGIPETIVRAHQISLTVTGFPDGDGGWTDEPALAFPFFRKGEIVNVKYRTPDKRFKQEKHAEKILYNLDGLTGQTWGILVEGEIDAMSYKVAEYPNVASVPDGAPQKPLKEENKRLDWLINCETELMALDKVYLSFDDDEPGHILTEEVARRLGKERCWRVRYPAGYKDANEVLIGNAGKGLPALGPDMLRQCIETAEPYPVEGVRKPEQFMDAVLQRYREGRARGLSTGLERIDELFTLVPGRLYVGTGFPGAGKSEFVDQLAVNAIHNHDWSIAYWSSENEPEEHIPKLIEKHWEMPFWDGPRPRMTEKDVRNGVVWLQQHIAFLGDDNVETVQDIDWILAKAKAAVLREGIRMLIVDPFNHIQGVTEYKSVTEFALGVLIKLVRFAKHHGVAVFLIAHPSKPDREDRTKAPGPYSISGSAHFFNVADIIFSVHRDRSMETPDVEVQCWKVRFKWIGKEGKATLTFDRATGIYRDSQRPNTAINPYEGLSGVDDEAVPF